MYLLTIFVIKFEQDHSTTHYNWSKHAWRVANSTDPDQKPYSVSELSLHCLLRSVCPKNWSKNMVHCISLGFFFF